MNPLGLGEHGKPTTIAEGRRYVTYINYRDWSGKGDRVRRSGKTKAESVRRALDAVREILEEGAGFDITKATRFREAYAGWLATFVAQVEAGERSQSSLDLYTGEAERVILPAIGDLRLGELRTPLLDRFVQGVLKDKGPSTAKVCKTVVSNTCGWAVRQGGITYNPMRELTPITAKTKKARALDVEELHKWIDALDASEYACRHDLPQLARFMLATGLRVGEAVGVTWADVDLVKGLVRVERTIIRVKGKGLVAKKVKSETSERPLFLPKWCITMLKERRERRRADDSPVFPSGAGTWRDRNAVQRSIRQVREGTDFEWLTTHTYRKTVATMLDEGGRSARAIADQLGHSRVSMTQDVYLGRKAKNAGNLDALEALNPDALRLGSAVHPPTRREPDSLSFRTN